MAGYPALLLASLIACVACGGKSNADRRDAVGGSAQGGNAGSTSGGKPSGGSASGGSGRGGSDNEPDCEALRDDDSQYVPVSIINDSSETLYVGQEQSSCGLVPLFEVTDAEGRPLAPPSACRSSCEIAMSSGPTGCPPVCLLPSAVELEPGETLSTEWTGTYVELVKLPTECQSAEFPAPQCDRAIAVQPGSFVFSATAGTQLDCSQSSGDCMTCQESRGGCVTAAALIAGDIRRAEVEVVLDASYGVGAGNGDGPIQFVELRFRDP